MDLSRNTNTMAQSAPSPKRRGSMKWLVVLLVIAAVLVVGAVFAKGYMEQSKIKSDYQAVFLNNGQVYFGKLELGGGWVKLTDIYYLQLTQDLQPASSSDANTQAGTGSAQNQQQQIQLVKLGAELHGPEDEMFIAKDKILFWENMKSDSKVMQSIRQYQNR